MRKSFLVRKGYLVRKSYQVMEVIKVREVGIAIEVKRSFACGDVLQNYEI